MPSISEINKQQYYTLRAKRFLSEVEQQQFNSLKSQVERDLDCVTCSECGSQWFERMEVARFDETKTLIPGQEIPRKQGLETFKMLRCIVCQEISVPNVQAFGRDVIASDYNHMLDTVEGKFDERKRVEDEKVNEISGKEL